MLKVLLCVGCVLGLFTVLNCPDLTTDLRLCAEPVQSGPNSRLGRKKVSVENLICRSDTRGSRSRFGIFIILQDPGPTQRSKKSQVEDNLRPEGDFDAVTNNREHFQPHQTFDRNQRAQNQVSYHLPALCKSIFLHAIFVQTEKGDSEQPTLPSATRVDVSWWEVPKHK